MTKRASTEEALGTIRAMRESPENHDLKGELGLFLRHTHLTLMGIMTDLRGRGRIGRMSGCPVALLMIIVSGVGVSHNR